MEKRIKKLIIISLLLSSNLFLLASTLFVFAQRLDIIIQSINIELTQYNLIFNETLEEIIKFPKYFYFLIGTFLMLFLSFLKEITNFIEDKLQLNKKDEQ